MIILTRDKILEAAINQYSLYSYHGATMQKIASEVGIKPASIYFFYKNKEVLFTAAFQRLLEEHFEQMRSIFNKVHHKPILKIFHSLMYGTVAYHRMNANKTSAYISLITSPPPEIQQFLHTHMKVFDDWLIDSLKESIKREIPNISDLQTSVLTKQFLLLMDGVFWEINLYDEETLNKQIDYAIAMIENVIGGMKNGE